MKPKLGNRFIGTKTLRQFVLSGLGLAFILRLSALSAWSQEFLVKDINTQQETTGSLPTSLVQVGSDAFYFRANDGINGSELWRSDGTADGTVMVANIAANSANADPSTLVNVNGTLYFTATDLVHGRELWKSDGTSNGTVMVKDIISLGSSNPSFLTAVGNLLFFAASDGSSGIELWQSDGTDAGTFMVKDINPGPASSNPVNLVAFNNLLFFSANSPSNSGAGGMELWSSDGTSAGTMPVKDINPGPASSNPQSLVVVSNTLFFAATSAGTGLEVWKTDGTAVGTVLVRDINPGSASSTPQALVSFNNALFFSANNGSSGLELWRSDGTSNTTVMVKDINAGPASSNPQNLAAVNGTLFFSAISTNLGTELWKSDGTTAGTVLVKDIASGTGSSSPANLVDVNGALFFSANNGTNAIPLSVGIELWTSDGTAAGTVLVRDIRVGSLSASPQSLANINGTLFFSADDGIVGRELWKSDGTFDGTVIVKNIRTTDGDSNPTNLVALNNQVLFTANDGTNGIELWSSDGTPGGTILLQDINAGTNSSSPAELTAVNGIGFFTATEPAHGRELWRTDGTPPGTTLVKDIAAGPTNSGVASLVNLSGTLYFSANDGIHGPGLWKSDGTTAGTLLATTVPTMVTNGTPTNLFNFDGTLVFAIGAPFFNSELWKSDGTAAGTVRLRQFSLAFNGTNSIPQNMANLNGTLFFSVSDGTLGTELWKSDGTTNGTVLVKDINPSGSSNPQRLTVAGNLLFFVANNGTNGAELWKSDGTEAGTVMVKDLFAGPVSSNPQNLFNVNGTLFFSANDGTNGIELWKSDGTANGTVLVADLNASLASSNPQSLASASGTLYFSATDGVNGRELWQTDGTGPGTFMVGDLTGDSTDSNPGSLTVAGNILFFAAQTAAIGRELFGLTLTVSQITPELIWTNPASIVYGKPLGNDELNATANVPGSFVYSPAAGTVLNAGTGQVLFVSFVPDDQVQYTNVSAAVTIDVAKAPLIATAANKFRPYGSGNPALTVSYSGFVNGDNASAIDAPPTPSTIATPASPVGTYAITLTGGSDNNYDLTLVNGILTVTPASLIVTANDASRAYGQNNPTFTGIISGVQNGDNITATYSSPATAASLVGTYPIIPALLDPDGKLSNYSVALNNGTLTITPAALTVTITSPASGFVQSVNSNITFVGTFTKSGASDSYLASWTFSSDGQSDVIVPGVVSNSTVTCVVQFIQPGVYAVALTVTNESGPSATATTVDNDLPAFVVIYDPDGGFVTGGGWLNSPAGAYLLDPGLSGRATFGFVSKYLPGAAVPTGQTEFSLHSAGVDFHSTSYDWLVISGARAQYKGSGRINNSGDFGFQLTALDGHSTQSPDRFRIKIWEKEHGIVVYDSQPGAPDNADPTTAIQGGSIVVHN